MQSTPGNRRQGLSSWESGLWRRRGWWGRRIVKDPLHPKAPPRLVQTGSPHRLKTIFNTNLRTSYAAGRWERIQRAKGELPYLRYVAVLDDRTRDNHAAWHGTVLPVDDAFWRSHYPPNGWGCRCIVQQLDDDDLERYGYEVTGRPAGWSRTREWTNKRTEKTLNVPIGIDPGWGHNTGILRSQVKLNRLNMRLDELAGPERRGPGGEEDDSGGAAAHGVQGFRDRGRGRRLARGRGSGEGAGGDWGEVEDIGG